MGLESSDWDALFWGCVSAVSFPIGAAIGIALRLPTKLQVALMSFGAGALLFTLSIELFGRAMQEMTEGKIGKAEVFCSMISAVLGALSFIMMNRFLGGHEVANPSQQKEHSQIAVSPDPNPQAGSGEYSDIPSDELHLGEPAVQVELGAMPPAHSQQTAERSPRASLVLKPDSLDEPAASPNSFRRHSVDGAECSRSRAVSLSEDGILHNRERAGSNTIADRSSSTRPLALAAGLYMDWDVGAENSLCCGPGMPTRVSDTEIPTTEIQEAEYAGAGAAMAIWLGLTMDGVPEAVVIGILANADEMSMALVIGVFLANFPEAIATAAMMHKAKMPWKKNICLWTSLCIMTGAVAMLAAIVFPKKKEHWLGFVTTSSEGLAAGAMLAMISGTMLPDAYKQGGSDLVGFWAVMGFLSVLGVRVMWPSMPDAPNTGLPEHQHHP